LNKNNILYIRSVLKAYLLIRIYFHIEYR